MSKMLGLYLTMLAAFGAMYLYNSNYGTSEPSTANAIGSLLAILTIILAIATVGYAFAISKANSRRK